MPPRAASTIATCSSHRGECGTSRRSGITCRVGLRPESRRGPPLDNPFFSAHRSEALSERQGLVTLPLGSMKDGSPNVSNTTQTSWEHSSIGGTVSGVAHGRGFHPLRSRARNGCRRSREWGCVSRGYDLRATPNCCPECGTASGPRQRGYPKLISCPAKAVLSRPGAAV